MLVEDLTARLGGYYQFGDYITSDREDNAWNVNARLGYKFLSDMLEVALRYGYTNRDCNLAGVSFDEHQIGLSLGFIYDRTE